jgi:hypothetical protein
MKRRKRPLRSPDSALGAALWKESARLTGADFPFPDP